MVYNVVFMAMVTQIKFSKDKQVTKEFDTQQKNSILISNFLDIDFVIKVNAKKS